MQAATAADPASREGSIFDPKGGRPARKCKDLHSPSATSSTLITLQVLARQQYFGGTLTDALRVAGFGNSKVIVGPALVTLDTGDTIAEPKWDGWLAAMGELAQIDVRCDPARCALEGGAGSRLVAVVRSLAHELDGYVADGTGREMSEEELTAVGQYIDLVLDQRADDEAPKGVKIDANTTRFPLALSFQHVDQVARKGRAPAFHHTFFPSSKTEWFEGRAEGTRRAAELIAFVREHRQMTPHLMETLSEIFTSGQWEKRYNPAGHIAGAFMEVVEEVFRVGCSAISQGWLIGRVQYSEKQAQLQRETAAEEKADFVKRMRAAKAAKKAEREGGAA